jgi:PEP-CTERM motif
MKKFATALATTALVFVTTAPASAATFLVNGFYSSGASFNGTVDFDGTKVTAVTGVLHGYAEHAFNYTGGSDSSFVNWVWLNGANFASQPGKYATFLMSGPFENYSNYGSFVVFSIDVTQPGQLQFATSNFSNAINNSDLFVEGNISPAGVPEPAAWALMIAGFGLTGAAMRRRKTSVQVTYA